MTTITGLAKLPSGAVYPGAEFIFWQADRDVLAQASAVVPPVRTTVTADDVGAVSFSLLPGNYIGRHPVTGVNFDFTVPDVSSTTFDACVSAAAAPVITGYPATYVNMTGGGSAQDYAGFATRAAFVTWASGKTPATGTVVHAGELDFRFAGTGAAISDLPEWEPAGQIRLDHWPVDLTGATNDRTAIAAAFSYASGKKIILPAGIINWMSTASALATLGSNTVIEGQGEATVLRMAVDSTSYRYMFGLPNANVTFRNLRIEFPTMANCQAAFANVASGGHRFEGVHWVGGVTGAGPQPHYAYVLNISSTVDFEGLHFEDCLFEGISWGMLKTNAATSVQKNIVFERCGALNCAANAFGSNNPSGGMTNMRVSNCWARNDADIGVNPIAVAVATGENVSVTNFSLEGWFWSALHFEEEVRRLVVSGVTARLDDGDFLDLTANNIGGTWASPEQVSITNFTAAKIGGRAGYGIRLTSDANPLTPCDNVVISGGTISGFATGVQCAPWTDTAIRIADLVIEDCTTGVQMAGLGAMGPEAITFRGCDEAIRATNGGIILRPTFFGNIKNHVVEQGLLHIHDPAFHWGKITTAQSGWAFVRLLSGVRRCNCDVTLRAFADNANRAMLNTRVVFDGTTSTVTLLETLLTGGFSGSIVNNLNVTAVSVTAGGTGYTVGDVLTVSGGTLESGGSRTLLRVDSAPSGVVTGVTIINEGQYTALPGSPMSVTGGTGTGATFTATSTLRGIYAKVFNNSGSSKDIVMQANASGVITVN